MMRKIVLFFGFILLWIAGFATHQRAGEITYKRLEGNTYEFTIVTYTYTPSAADRPQIEVFWGDNTSSIISRQSKISVGPDISENKYVTTHTFAGNRTYSITFEDPDRNYGIINIPNSVNIPFFIETQLVINPNLGINNSVILLNPPLDNGCVNTTYYHNVGAYDMDGDSLSYQLIDCRGFEGQPISGYTLPHASQFFTLDEVTGDLIWETPQTIGEYNIAILISEYRKGQLVGSVVRDMQITIAACDNKPPKIFREDTCVIAGDLISLDILVADENSTNVTLTGSGSPFLDAVSPAIPLNMSGSPPMNATFRWQTACAHIKKAPHQLLLRASDNGPQVNLSSFKTVNINVIAPAPQNLTSSSHKNTITLEWDKYNCLNAREIHIYKRADSSYFEPDICETGIPADAKFQLLAKVSDTSYFYLDDGSVSPIVQGREYCYRLVAVFGDGAQSIASNETCAAIANDAPMITNVDVEHTSESAGVISVTWLVPPEIDTVNFPGPKYEYRVFRSENNNSNFQSIASTYSLYDTSFIDNQLNTDSIQYYYKIEFWGENQQGELEWIETSDPASSIFLSIYETDKRLKITWNEQVPWNNEIYIIYRLNENTQMFDSIGVATENQYDDVGLFNGETYCYFIKSVGRYTTLQTVASFLNRSQVSCGTPYDNLPPDTPNPEIKTDCENVTFLWTFPYADSYLDAYQYYIYYRPDYQTPLTCIDSFTYYSPCFPSPCSHIIQNLPSVTGCYAMLIKDAVGNFSEITPELCFDVDECDPYSLPNVFTPDGDGTNDTWLPFPYSNVQKIDLVVHDRWGKRVFKTDDPNINWDGTAEETNRPLPEGVYYYGCDVFLYTLEGVKKKFLSGTVTILRGSSGKQNY